MSNTPHLYIETFSMGRRFGSGLILAAPFTFNYYYLAIYPEGHGGQLQHKIGTGCEADLA
jgi:hypothetical protein